MTVLLLYVVALLPVEGFLLYLSLKGGEVTNIIKHRVKSSLAKQSKGKERRGKEEKEGSRVIFGDIQLTFSLLEHLKQLGISCFHLFVLPLQS